jgi:hypothetical protein
MDLCQRIILGVALGTYLGTWIATRNWRTAWEQSRARLVSLGVCFLLITLFR